MDKLSEAIALTIDTIRAFEVYGDPDLGRERLRRASDALMKAVGAEIMKPPVTPTARLSPEEFAALKVWVQREAQMMVLAQTLPNLPRKFRETFEGRRADAEAEVRRLLVSSDTRQGEAGANIQAAENPPQGRRPLNSRNTVR